MSILLGPFDDTAAPKDVKEDEQLLVFGYACKLFRDDTKALLESSGQLLIPWMGDNSLMVDRYDVRNRLEDKSLFGVKSNLPYKMSAKERELEEELDKERYLALHWDDIRVEEQEEEERRRATENSIYSAIGFSYNDKVSEAPPNTSAPPPPKRGEPVTNVEEGEEFVPPQGLVIPEGMKLPATKKLHSIIQKTAFFVCQQGTQMEIIIKTKQQSNPFFSFLDLSDSLYPYYSHLKAVLANGSYVPSLEPPEPEPTNAQEIAIKSNEQDETENSGQNEVVEKSRDTKVKGDEDQSAVDEDIPTAVYGPEPEPSEVKGQSASSNAPMVVYGPDPEPSTEKDQGVSSDVPTVVYGPDPEPSEVKVQSSPSEDEESGSDSDDEGGYLHPLLMQAMQPRSKSSTPTPMVPTTTKEDTPPPREEAPSLSAVSFRAKSLIVNAAPDLKEKPVETVNETTVPNSTSGDGSHTHSGPPPQYIDSASPYPDVGGYPPSSYDDHYHHYPHTAHYSHPHGPPPDQYDYNYEAYYAAMSGYHTGSMYEATPAVQPPPPDLQSIIDKTAVYVAKNGSGFEATILKRHADDPRFSFLNPWGEYHSYYCQQKGYSQQQVAQEQWTNHTSSDSNFTSERPGIQKLNSSGAVSFKLKTTKAHPDGGHFAESAQGAGTEDVPAEPPAKKSRFDDKRDKIGSTFKEFLSTVKDMFGQTQTSN